MRTQKVIGIIIKRRNIGEADRILTIFTKGEGKIHIKAKGVRKITSKRSSHVELLNFGVCTIYKGKAMPILLEIQTHNVFYDIKTDLQKTGFAYHICELIDGLCPENQENTRVFELLVETLHKLAITDTIALVIHEFEVELLSLLGYWSTSKIFSSREAEQIIEGILERKLKTLQILPQLQ